MATDLPELPPHHMLMRTDIDWNLRSSWGLPDLPAYMHQPLQSQAAAEEPSRDVQPAIPQQAQPSPSMAHPGIPPTLPPSVEEAYRRKCIQLKRRIAETDDENKKMRIRLELLKRAIEHLKLERKMLHDQMSEIERRTAATNLSDSEGSPPPPPTPKEKPLRIKRPHRKPSFLQGLGESARPSFTAQDPATVSPSSDGFSRPRDGAPARSVSAARQPSALPRSSGATNGNGRTSAGAGIKKPNNAYELFSQEMRPQVQVSQQEAIGENRVDVDNELAKGWRGLGEAEQADWQRRFEAERESWARDKNSGRGRMRDSFGSAPANRSLSRDQAATPMKHEDNDGDVAMPDEVEEAGPSLRHGHEGGGNSGGGFTAVNGP